MSKPKKTSREVHPPQSPPPATAPPTLASGWDGRQWKNRCAWCHNAMPEDQPVYAISLCLRAEAFREFEPGTIQPLYLAAVGRLAPMIVLKPDAPAKQEGKDAVFQLCSETCAHAFQAALKKSLEREAGT